MYERMTTLVATYAREIVEELARSREKPPVDQTSASSIITTKHRMASSIGQPTEYDVLEVDMKIAEAVGTCSRVFPEPDGSSVKNWFVFARHLILDRPDTLIFSCVGVIHGDTGADAFVRDAYQLILFREVDATGIELYPPLVENRQLSQRDVIRILADSDEARERGVCSVVIPQPSSWLQGFKSVNQMPLLTDKTAG